MKNRTLRLLCGGLQTPHAVRPRVSGWFASGETSRSKNTARPGDLRRTVAVCVLALTLTTCAFAKHAPALPEAERPIDLVICLDTSGSMSGLIEAAKQKLWDIVNELGRAKPKPHLRVALYVYGTPGYGAETGYVRKLIELTDDLDAVYAQRTSMRWPRNAPSCKSKSPNSTRSASSSLPRK